MYWADPIKAGSAGGYDYAIVRLVDAQDSIALVAHSGTQTAPRRPYQAMNVDVFGGASGWRRGIVSGALSQLGDSQRQWLSCWQFAPSFLLQDGDSGSLALGVTAPYQYRVFGHFVAGCGVPKQGFAHQYVQDLRSCLADGLESDINI
ncbi:hypothetical protein [Streptomyces nigrescens]|uniref:hypothetical protein n=1 Tax=Streptomyces nigrescens TaxID=1920 RepID=UPI00225700F7|nr:hypothetical protein [Streptomyces libani]MCX5449903.1 hypothetical protein [Streptomyces libani]